MLITFKETVMEEPKVKKTYTRPQIFVVKLDHEQAILSACSLMATSAQAGGGSYCRVQNRCKKAFARGDSGARAS